MTLFTQNSDRRVTVNIGILPVSAIASWALGASKGPQGLKKGLQDFISPLLASLSICLFIPGVQDSPGQANPPPPGGLDTSSNDFLVGLE